MVTAASEGTVFTNPTLATATFVVDAVPVAVAVFWARRFCAVAPCDGRWTETLPIETHSLTTRTFLWFVVTDDELDHMF